MRFLLLILTTGTFAAHLRGGDKDKQGPFMEDTTEVADTGDKYVYTFNAPFASGFGESGSSGVGEGPFFRYSYTSGGSNVDAVRMGSQGSTHHLTQARRQDKQQQQQRSPYDVGSSNSGADAVTLTPEETQRIQVGIGVAPGLVYGLGPGGGGLYPGITPGFGGYGGVGGFSSTGQIGYIPSGVTTTYGNGYYGRRLRGRGILS